MGSGGIGGRRPRSPSSDSDAMTLRDGSRGEGVEKTDAEHPLKAEVDEPGPKANDDEEELVAEDSNLTGATGLKKSPAPLLVSGKRDRRRTKVFEATTSTPATSRRREQKKGNGIALGLIPNVSFLLNSAKGRDDELILLHRILFNSVGVATKRKTNIREFCGFVFDSDKDRDRVQQRLSKEPIGLIRKVAQVLDLPNVSVGKPALIDAVIAFLEDPKPGEDRVDLAARAQKRKDERAKKRERKMQAADKGKSGKGKGKRKRKNTDTDSDSGTDGDDDEDDAVVSRVAAGSGTKKKQAKSKLKSKLSAEESDDSDEEELDEDDELGADEIDDEEDNDKNHPGENEDDEDVAEPKDVEDGDEPSDTKAEDRESEPATKKARTVGKAKFQTQTEKVTGKDGKKSPSKERDSAGSQKGHKDHAAQPDDEEEELEEGMPSKKDLDAALTKLLQTENVENLTVRSVRTSLETQFGCSLQSRMSFLRNAVAEKLK